MLENSHGGKLKKHYTALMGQETDVPSCCCPRIARRISSQMQRTRVRELILNGTFLTNLRTKTKKILSLSLSNAFDNV